MDTGAEQQEEMIRQVLKSLPFYFEEALYFAAFSTKRILNKTDTYDVVIVGSGLGGLLCAVFLAREGMKVCVLERDRQIGGCLQTFALQKKVFDSCVHYIGGLGEGHTLWHLFRYAGIMDRLELKALDENGFDRIVLPGDPQEYPHAVGRERFVEELQRFFPEERKALETYLSLMREVTDRFPLYRLRAGDVSEKAPVLSWGLDETIARVTRNPKLQQVLLGNNLLYAGVKGKTPFYLHALVTESYLHSAHKVIPGSSQISKFLWQELQALGGTIIRHTTVTRLVEEHGLLSWAETADRQRFYGKQFISGIHPELLLDLLDTPLIRPAYRQRIRSLEQTEAAFMLNLVLKPGMIPHRNYNLYCHLQDDVLLGRNRPLHDWPQQYALYSGEDPAHPGYSDTLSVLTYLPYEAVKEWDGTVNFTATPGERGAAYETFKQQHSERLLRLAETQIPGIGQAVQAMSAATPLTYRDYTGAPRGGMYGILKDVHEPAKTTIAVRSRIPNLLLTGQNVNLHGVLGVSITAVATCAELLGLDYLLGKIDKN